MSVSWLVAAQRDAQGVGLQQSAKCSITTVYDHLCIYRKVYEQTLFIRNSFKEILALVASSFAQWPQSRRCQFEF